MNKFILILIFCITNLFSANLLLTQEEERWLRNNPVIKVGIDPNFAPVEFIDKDGNFKGVTADYLDEMKKSLGIEFEIVKNRTWNEIINMVKTKSIDVLSCIVKTPERSNYLDYTSTYLSVPMVIVTNKTSGYINNLKELNGKSVALIDGYTPIELIEKNHKGIFVVKTQSLTEALKLVASGKTFAHVGNLSRVTYLLEKKGFQNLTISGITHYTYNFSMGIQKENQMLRNIMEKAFNAIPKEVRNKIYNKWFPLNYRKEKDYTLVWEILAITFIITLVFSLWVFKLNRILRRRIVDKAALIEDKEWLNASLESVNLAAWEWDFQTGHIKGNPSFAEILGREKKEFSMHMKYFKKLVKKEDLDILLMDLEKHFSKKSEKSISKIRIETKDKKTKYIEFTAKIEKFDIFNNPKKVVGVIKEIKED